MKSIGIILGVLTCFVGLLCTAYYGVWFMFVGGIVSMIEGAKADPVNAMDIAVGFLRFTFSWTAWFGVIISVGLGGLVATLFGYENPKKKKNKKLKASIDEMMRKARGR